MIHSIEEMVGVTLRFAENVDDTITLKSATDTYSITYLQDCCASCSVVDIAGDLKDLVGTPVVMAEMVRSRDNPANLPTPEYQDSFTWTFVKFATAKGYVTITWYGESNGYYSETPTFMKNGRSYEFS